MSSSRRTRSLRKAARERYRAAARAEAPGAPAQSAPAAPSLTERVRGLYEDTVVPVREIAARAGVTERTIYKYAQKLGWKPRYVRLARGAGGRFIALADQGKPHARGIAAVDPERAARAAVCCARAGALSDQAVAEAVAAARLRAEQDAAERLAAARRKADRAQENQLRTLLLIARMQREGGTAMRAELKATLAKVHELFDARLAAAERAAEGQDATEAERHIVRALRQLREAPPQAKRAGGESKPHSNWTSPRDNLSEEEQRKELERSLINLVAGSPPNLAPSSPGRREAPRPGDPRRPRESGDRLQSTENDPGSRPPDQNREPRPG
jgi:hypothetical protein